MFIRNVLLFVSVFFFMASSTLEVKSKKRELEFTFHVNNKIGIQPSYQMAIWLEKPDGTYIKTLYISDYVSFGGFNHKEICPEWNIKSNWAQVSSDVVDAVTGATPMTGDLTLSFKCQKKQIPPGPYKYFIEVHLLEDYNELYSGEILIGKEDTESTPEVKYIPKKHSKAGDILSDIIVMCKKK